MVFSSPIFVFKFLPLALLAILVLVHPRFRNAALLTASLVFYAWGEVYFVFLLVFSILLNFLTGRYIDTHSGRKRKAGLIIGISINVGMLLFFKYANFIIENLNRFFPGPGKTGIIDWPEIPLPLAISFFTFQGLSYVIDVYRRAHPAEKNFGTLALLVSFFPHLIAGPIVRYSNIAKELTERAVTAEKFVYGIKRFIIGLIKKAIIGDTLGKAVSFMLALEPSDVTLPIVWIGVITLTLQIYYDFSGYSDMAIGLAAMFGFTFPENFKHPYTSRSMSEFWRNWHITLSNWFRDYIYIPLGGSRKGKWLTYMNLFFMLFLMGIWHGAAWTYVVLGIYAGLVVVMEKLWIRKALEKAPRFLGHLYFLFALMAMMTIFRSESLGQLQLFAGTFVGMGNNTFGTQAFYEMVSPELVFYILVGIIFSMPLTRWFRNLKPLQSEKGAKTWRIAEPVVFFLGLVFALSAVAAGTYQPFIYFKF